MPNEQKRKYRLSFTSSDQRVSLQLNYANASMRVQQSFRAVVIDCLLFIQTSKEKEEHTE